MRLANCAILATSAFLSTFTLAQQSASRAEVYRDMYHDTSAPANTYTDATPASSVQRIIRPLPQRQVPGPLLTEDEYAMQMFSLPKVGATIGKNFEGLSDSANTAFLFVPSDNNIAVGATQVVETINIAYRVINKSTSATVLSKQISSLFTGVSGLWPGCHQSQFFRSCCGVRQRGWALGDQHHSVYQ
jgi:hypothetical protein